MQVRETVQTSKVRSHALQLFSFHKCMCSIKLREALKKAYDELPKNRGAVDVDTFVNLMLEYKPLMRELDQ